jgi:hypothetical protein
LRHILGNIKSDGNSTYDVRYYGSLVGGAVVEVFLIMKKRNFLGFGKIALTDLKQIVEKWKQINQELYDLYLEIER